MQNQAMAHNANITQNAQQNTEHNQQNMQSSLNQHNNDGSNPNNVQQNQFGQLMAQSMQFQPTATQLIVPQQPQNIQLQYAKYVQMLQQYNMMLQHNPALNQDQKFIQQYVTVQNAIKQVEQQIASPAKVIVGGNQLNNALNTLQQSMNSINGTQSGNTSASVNPQQQSTPSQSNRGGFDFSTLNFNNITNDNLPDLSAYLNAGLLQQTTETTNENDNNMDLRSAMTTQSIQNAISDTQHGSNTENNSPYTSNTHNNASNASYSGNSANIAAANSSSSSPKALQLSLPNLNQSTFKPPPNQSNTVPTQHQTAGGPTSDATSSSSFHDADDIQRIGTNTSQYSSPDAPRKRGRGRPRGSKNKKTLDVAEIDQEIATKKAEITAVKNKFAKAKQSYLHINNWLRNSAETHQRGLVQKYYGNYFAQPQYALYTQQQIMQLAQQAATSTWQGEYSKLQQQSSTACRQMNELQTKLKAYNQQLRQSQNKRDDAVKNAPSGPIADFQAQYLNKAGRLAPNARYSNGMDQMQQQQQQQQQPQQQQQRQQQQQQQQQRQSYQQPQQRYSSSYQSNNPWQQILDSNLEFVPQWVQCVQCRKWRVLHVSTEEISRWKEPSGWNCSYQAQPNNHCEAPQQKPDQSTYTALQLNALTIQRSLKMKQSQMRQSGTNVVSQSELTRRMHEYRQKQEFESKNNDTFSKLMNLVGMKERKAADERFDMLKKQKLAEKEAIRTKKKEHEATRVAKKKKLRNQDSDDEYLPDSDDTSDDEDYEDSGSDLDEDDMLLDRQQMRARHQAPSSFNFKALLSMMWSHEEVMALVTFAAANDNQFPDDLLSQHQILSVRHNNAVQCKQKLEEITSYAQQMQNPRGASSSVLTRSGGTRNQSVDSDDDEAYDGPGPQDNDDQIWGGSRKSRRLASKKSKKVNYAEELAIDKYLAREEAEVRTQQKAQNDIYVEKIERILAVKTVFMAPKTDEVYDDMQHALDHGCKASELLEQTRYLIKLDGISYLHCEWQTEHQMVHRFGKLRTTRKMQSWNRKRLDYESKCELLWGGEPFDPSFAEVDRVIDCIDVNGVKKYYVKWMGLSYSCCTYETVQDIDEEIKIEQYERWNTLPTDTKARHLDDTAFKKGMYGWYKITEELEQPAQTEADAQMKKELQNTGVKPDPVRVYKGEHILRDYQVIGLNWLIQKFYEGSNSILADEMGLGKTVQSTTFIEHLYRVNNVHGPFLIVAPLSTLFHWKREIEAWTDLNCVVYHDSDRGQLSREIIRNHEFYYAKSKRKTPKFNILLTTYEILMCDLEWLANIKWFLCVVDEGHRLKSRSTQLTKSFQMLDASRRVLLTGTPIQNSMDELFNLLHFLEPKEFSNLRDFNRIYGGTSHNNGSKTTPGTTIELENTNQLKALQERIQQYILRRLKENVEKSIPKKEETIIDIELTTIQKTYYRALFDRNREFLEAGVDKGNAINLINLEVQLRKCCNHPWLIDGTIDRECGVNLSHEEYMEKTIAASGKMVLLDKLLPKLKREGHRVLIFSQMRKVLNILEEYLQYKEYIYERFDGTTASHDRQSAMDRFCAPGSDRLVFLLTTRAGGQGLNLVAADTVIIFDSDWNPQQDIQAQARCHRIGQKKAVMVYRLVTKNTYEAQMFERASRKLGLGQAILKSVEHGVKKKDVQDLKDLDNMLRHGAYAILHDDDEATRKWQECDIDDLLQHASHRIEHNTNNGDNTNNRGIGMHSFTRKTFESDKAKATAGLDVTGKNFWNDLWKIKQQSSKGDEDLYLDNYLLDDRTRADRLLTSLTSMKDAASEAADAKRKENRMEDSDLDSDVIDDDVQEKIFTNDKQRDKWFKRYKLHMTKMVNLKESPSREVPSLELQIQLSELVSSLHQYFTRKQQRQIAQWNSKLTQRNRRKAKMSLNEDALSGTHLFQTIATRSSKRKRKRGSYNEDEMDLYQNNKKRKGNNMESSPRDALDKVWAFDYPSYAFSWNDFCAHCEKGGSLILCEGPCVGSFHLECLGFDTEPVDDPWYCNQCKELKAKREETYKATGGKSSRFKPGSYKVKVWMDKDTQDPYDVYQTEAVLDAKCFYPNKKSKTKRSSKKKKKRPRSENEDDPKDADYNIDSDDGKPVRKRAKRSAKKKAKSTKGKKGNDKPVDDDIFAFGTRMTRSRKKNLSKILNEGKNDLNEEGDAQERNTMNEGNDMEEKGTEQDMETHVDNMDNMDTNDEGMDANMDEDSEQQCFNTGNQLKIDFNSLGSVMNMNNMNFNFANDNANVNNKQNNIHVNDLNNMNMNSLNNMLFNNMNNVNQTPNNTTTIINNITNIHNIGNAANMNHGFGGNFMQ